MITRGVLVPALLVLLLVPGIRAETTSQAAPDTPAGKEAKAKEPVAQLTQGMPANDVLRIMGKPDEIKPFKAPTGKAESWVYNQEGSIRIEHLQLATPDIVTNSVDSNGGVGQVRVPGRIEIHEIRYVSMETIELLMFNEHFVVHKVSRWERKL